MFKAPPAPEEYDTLGDTSGYARPTDDFGPQEISGDPLGNLLKLRQMLIDVRLHMSLRGSLLLGLESIASTTGENQLVYRLLRMRMSGGQVKSGLEIFQQMAKDLKSAHLTRITQRIQAAQQSGGLLGVDQAVAKSIEELTDDINGQTEEQMQRLPLRITILAMPFLLGPIVILFFYPLVDRILKTLSGTAIGGGF